jgi:hypothetical protein
MYRTIEEPVRFCTHTKGYHSFKRHYKDIKELIGKIEAYGFNLPEPQIYDGANTEIYWDGAIFKGSNPGLKLKRNLEEFLSEVQKHH